MEGEYIDVKQLCAWLGLKLPTAYKMMESGEIPSYKLGKLRRLKVDEVQAWIAGCKCLTHSQLR